MTTLKRITEGGIYTEDIILKGTNRNEDIGLIVDVPLGQHVALGNIFISEVFIPIIKTGKGLLTFEKLYTKGFGGDNFNVRGNGNIVGDTINVDHHTPTRPYNRLYREGDESVIDCLARNGETVYDPSLLRFEWYIPDPKKPEVRFEVLQGCHVDAIMQLYATLDDGHTLDPNGSISNVVVPNIVAHLANDKTQGIMGSEKCEYTGIKLGTKKFVVNSAGYPYHTSFNSLTDSFIGCGDNNITPGCKIRVMDVKKSGKPIGNNRYNGFAAEDVIGDTSMVDNVRMKTIEVPDYTEIPSDLSVAKFAAEWGIEAAKLEAILITESGKDTHHNGFPTLLFERHVMHRVLLKEGVDVNTLDPKYNTIVDRSPYGAGAYGSFTNQKVRFQLACEISPSAAIQACSWGFAQVLGENYEMCGFYSPEDFQNGMLTREGQLYAFLNYVANREGLMQALRMADWYEVKRLYNGPTEHDADNNGIDDYVEKLIKNYTRAVNSKAPNRDVSVPVKSRTIRNMIKDVIVKGTLSGGTVVAGASMDDIVSTIQAGADKLALAKEAIEKGADSVGDASNAVVAATGGMFDFTSISYLIAGIILATLFFNFRTGKAYLEDQGYSKIKGKFDDLIG